MQEQNRQLAAILFTDIMGYTAMMQQDEQNAVAVTRHYITVLKLSVAAHHGKILNDYGDGSLCSFSSATEAMRFAIEMQQQLQNEPRVPLRIGLHVGELFFEGDKVMGDGVNVASRIQSLGIANSILFSSEINNKLKNQQDFKSVSVGRFHFKNVDEPMEIFALANEGFVIPEKKKMEGKLQKRNSSYRTIIPAASMLLLAVASFFVYSKYFNKAEFSGNEKSIAILPFKVSGNSDEALSEGLVEDILAHLMKIKELKVISNRSSGYYIGSKKSLKEIGEELNVNSLMTGSIQQIGSRIRVVVQLMDSKTGDLIWTDIYDRDNIQIFDLQTELATKIVNSLETTLTSQEKRNLLKHYTENVEAYKFYRKGRWFWDKRYKESYDSAEFYFKKAIQLDPDYALAYSGLADCYTNNQKGLSQIEAMPIAGDYVSQALMLDSNLSEAWATKAFIQSHFNYDWKGAKSILKKVISDNPNYSIAHLYYGNVLLFTGNTEESFKETKKALELDPLSSSINFVLGRNYYYARNYDLSITQLLKTLGLDPNFKRAYQYLGYSYLQKKLYPEAIDAFSKLPPKPFGQGASGTILLGLAYSISGDTEKAKAEVEKITNDDRVKISPYFMAEFYLSLGNLDKALTQLERGFDIHDLPMVTLKIDPILDPIRNEPRFKELLKKMNLD